MLLLIVQLLVPLLLIALLAIPARSWTPKLIQAAAGFLYLAAVHLAGLWLELPWWTPWVLWALYGLALAVALRRGCRASQAHKRAWLVNAAWVAGAVGAGWLCATALLSRVPPEGPIVDVSSPLPPGRYVVVNGGSRGLTDSHLETLRPRTARQAAYRGQSYGIDIAGLTAWDRISDGWSPSDPRRYAIFGTPIVAPCSGRVIARLDGRRDMPVPLPDQQVMPGNHVVLECGGVHLLLAHMRQGSVSVRRGQAVRIGDKLGEVGNSGNSASPHLHIHAQRPGPADRLFAGDPLPLRIGGRYLVRGGRL